MILVAVVLAAGEGKRFGANKLLAQFDGAPILQKVLREVKKCGFEKILVPFSEKSVEKIILAENCEPVFNENSKFGQSESVKLGVKFAPKTDALAFFVGDNPKIESDFVKKMMAKFAETNKIIAPVFDGKMGNPVIFPSRFFAEFFALEGDVGGKKIVLAHKSEVFEMTAPKTVLFDIDEKKDLRG